VDVALLSADDWLRLNRAWWDQRAPVHAASGFYDVPGFLVGKDSLRVFIAAEITQGVCHRRPTVPFSPTRRSRWVSSSGLQ
jgi:hypothetical protein